MILKLPKSLFLIFLVTAFCSALSGQNVVYTDTFTQSSSYASGSSQWNNWGTFRSALDTSTKQFTKLTVKGTYNTTGRTCADKSVVRKLAAALKAGASSSYSCNGYTWMTGTCGNGPELSVDGTMCNCVTSTGWSVRPTIGSGNSNWGGIASNTCNGPTQRLTVIFETVSKNNDMSVSTMTSPDRCTYTQGLSTRLTNFGKLKVDSFRLYWSVNGVLQTPKYITSSLLSLRDTTIVLNSSFSFTKNTTYKFKVWTALPNGQTDSVASNDTLTLTVNFSGYPSAPTTSNTTQCGAGKALLQATPADPSDSIAWYDQSTGGNFIGLGKSIYSPVIKKTTTFYAQVGSGNRTKIDNGFTGNTIVSASTTLYNGAYFNITPTKTIYLDSLMPRIWNNSTTGWKVYYKVGTHVGSETNASAWTLLANERGRTVLNGGRYFSRVNAGNVKLNAGQTYGFYISTDVTLGGNDFYLTNGTNPKSNSDVAFSGSIIVNSQFGSTGLYSTWMVDIELSYGFAPLSPCISSAPRVPMTVTVKPRPIGADLVKGSTFQGQFNVGDVTKPDVAEVGKTNGYIIVPPTGHTNSGHTSTWVINSVTVKTKYGYTIPTSEYTYTPPSGSNPGTIVLLPTSTYLDSIITFLVRYSDLGPNFCDSTVQRTVVIAPTPRPNFKFPSSVCVGDAVFFENQTLLHSGQASYQWYFGTQDSSDNENPVFVVKQSGAMNVRLIAKSYPWGVIKDTTIVVNVGELPEAKFKANNKCQGIPVSFQNQTTVGNGTLTYDWDFGDGSAHSSSVNPNHLYSTPGGYKVTLKASANGCVSTLIKNAYMFARPVANFNAPLAPICAKTEVILPNTSTLSQGAQGAYWSFGDGKSSTLLDGENTYDNAGTYSVKLLAVSEFDCRDSVTKTVTIKPTPNPDFDGNQFCANIKTIFTNKTTETVPNPSYTWTFSDNFTTNTKNVSRNWPHEGPYSATLMAAFSNGCSASVSKNFEVLIQPKADFNVKDICSGETADFVNKTTGDKGNIQFAWDFGNNTSSNLTAPRRLYNPSATTTYTVTLVASYIGGCSDTVLKTITVSESPICDFTSKDLGFYSVKFSPANTAYTRYEWFFGEGGSSTDVSPTYKYSYSGNFTVTMKATNVAGCTCESSKKYSVNTGIESIGASNGISVYPNPNNGTFTITNNDNKAMKVEVFNVLGSKVYSANSAEGNMTVNLEGQAKGIYLVKVTINGATTTLKITVTN